MELGRISETWDRHQHSEVEEDAMVFAWMGGVPRVPGAKENYS